MQLNPYLLHVISALGPDNLAHEYEVTRTVGHILVLGIGLQGFQ